MTCNPLPISKLDFARISCLNEAVYGVKDFCSICDPFNTCLRGQLDRVLSFSLDYIERLLGYNITPRYHEQEILWDGSTTRVALDWKGLESINVGCQLVPIVGLESVPVDPFIIRGAAMEDSGNGYCHVLVPRSLAEDVSRLSFWRAGHPVGVQDLNGYPRVDVNGNWQIPLNQSVVPACLNWDVDVYSCDYTFIDVPLIDLEGCDNPQPLYPNGDPIPFLRTEEVGGTILRFWFQTYSLINSNYSGIADITKGEFYKFLQSISFGCFKETLKGPVVLNYEETCDCPHRVFREDDQSLLGAEQLVRITPLFQEDSIVLLEPLYHCSCLKRNPIKIRLAYKTDPKNIRDISADIQGVKEAVVWTIAANLDTQICGCPEGTWAFITKAQQPVDDILTNLGTGMEIVRQTYEKSYGKEKAKAILSKIPKKFRKVAL